MKTLRCIGSSCTVVDDFAPGKPEINFTGTWKEGPDGRLLRVEPGVAQVSDETAALLMEREPGHFEEVKESKTVKAKPPTD